MVRLLFNELRFQKYIFKVSLVHGANMVLSIMIMIGGSAMYNKMSKIQAVITSFQTSKVCTFILFASVIAFLLNFATIIMWNRCRKPIRRVRIIQYKIIVLAMIANIFITLILVFSAVNVLQTSKQIHKNFKGEITKAMKYYNYYGQAKIDMDQMQIEYECCGSTSYTDWFNIPWYEPQSTILNYNKRVPFSCCDTKLTQPCVMNNIKSTEYNPNEDVYKPVAPYVNFGTTLYNLGCADALTTWFKTNHLVTLAYMIYVMCFLNVICLVPERLLETAFARGVRIKNIHLPVMGYLLFDDKKKNKQKQMKLLEKKSKKVATREDKKLDKKKEQTPKKDGKNKNQNNSMCMQSYMSSLISLVSNDESKENPIPCQREIVTYAKLEEPNCLKEPMLSPSLPETIDLNNSNAVLLSNESEPHERGDEVVSEATWKNSETLTEFDPRPLMDPSGDARVVNKSKNVNICTSGAVVPQTPCPIITKELVEGMVRNIVNTQRDVLLDEVKYGSQLRNPKYPAVPAKSSGGSESRSEPNDGAAVDKAAVVPVTLPSMLANRFSNNSIPIDVRMDVDSMSAGVEPTVFSVTHSASRYPGRVDPQVFKNPSADAVNNRGRLSSAKFDRVSSACDLTNAPRELGQGSNLMQQVNAPPVENNIQTTSKANRDSKLYTNIYDYQRTLSTDKDMKNISNNASSEPGKTAAEIAAEIAAERFLDDINKHTEKDNITETYNNQNDFMASIQDYLLGNV